MRPVVPLSYARVIWLGRSDSNEDKVRQRHLACRWPTTERRWLPVRDSNPHLHVQSVRSLHLNEPGTMQTLAPRVGFEQTSRCLTGSRFRTGLISHLHRLR
jgi:hypothetical protein